MFRYKMLPFFKQYDFDKQIEEKNKELGSLNSQLKADNEELLIHRHNGMCLTVDLEPVDLGEWSEHRDFLCGLREKTLEKIKTTETELKQLNQLQDASKKLKQAQQDNAKDPSSDLFKLKFKIK